MSQPSRLKKVRQVDSRDQIEISQLNDIGGHAGIVRRYYDQTTRLFMKFGGANTAYAIHRAVWSGDGDTFDSAINRTNAGLLRSLRDAAPTRGATRVADLGCGIGGSLFYLAAHWGAELLGIGLTISKTQVELAQARARTLKLDGATMTFVHGDYLRVPIASASHHAACAIESYCHAPDPARFFSEVSRILRPGGRLVLCDDFLARASDPGAIDPGDAFWLRAYLEGWRVPELTTLARSIDLAAQGGLRMLEKTDLTPQLRLRAVPHVPALLMIAAARPFAHAHEIFPSMIGSIALQHCLKRGLVEYQFVVFEKQSDQ